MPKFPKINHPSFKSCILTQLHALYIFLCHLFFTFCISYNYIISPAKKSCFSEKKANLMVERVKFLEINHLSFKTYVLTQLHGTSCTSSCFICFHVFYFFTNNHIRSARKIVSKVKE